MSAPTTRGFASPRPRSPPGGYCAARPFLFANDRQFVEDPVDSFLERDERHLSPSFDALSIAREVRHERPKSRQNQPSPNSGV